MQENQKHNTKNLLLVPIPGIAFAHKY